MCVPIVWRRVPDLMKRGRGESQTNPKIHPSLRHGRKLKATSVLLLSCACFPCWTVTPQTKPEEPLLSCFCSSGENTVVKINLTAYLLVPVAQAFCSSILLSVVVNMASRASMLLLSLGKLSVPSKARKNEHHRVQPFTGWYQMIVFSPRVFRTPASKLVFNHAPRSLNIPTWFSSRSVW